MPKENLTRQDVYFYKDLYSGHKIIYVRFLSEEYLFRTLTRKEYKYIKLCNDNKYNLEDAICTAACIYPEGQDFSLCQFAGLVPRCSAIIEYQSGFSDLSMVLQEYHELKERSSMEIQCMDLIKAFIPEYTYEEMEDWTWEKLMKITIRAEAVAKMRGYEWSLQDVSEEVVEKLTDMNIKNDKFTQELIQNGVDPMMYFYDDLKDKFKHDIIDFPMIVGTHWRNDEVINLVRAQIHRRAGLRRQ